MLINGSAESKFIMERGLRQGFSLSSLLFNLVVESFLILVNQFENNQWLQGTQISCLRNRLFVLQYANDTIICLRRSNDLGVKL